MWNGISLQEYEGVKEHLICRLVRTEALSFYREVVFSRAFADLAVVPCLFKANSDGTAVSCPVTLSVAAGWPVSHSRLTADALANMQRLLPAVLEPMEQLMGSDLEGSAKSRMMGFLQSVHGDAAPERLGQLAELLARQIGLRAQYAAGLNAMWVLGNKPGIFGAASLLYPGILQDFAQKAESSLFLLPSSIHEVILLPESGRETESLLHHMVRTGNEKMAAMPEKILSDGVYYYDRKKKEIRLF